MICVQGTGKGLEFVFPFFLRNRTTRISINPNDYYNPVIDYYNPVIDYYNNRLL